MQYFFKSDDPVRDAERHANQPEMRLHTCWICRLDIDHGEKYAIHTAPDGLDHSGYMKWKDLYFCEFCLRTMLEDLTTYEEEELDV